MNQTYLDTARLLTQVAPLVFVDDTFALKGGTAINLFVRDMPRLSVDLDLVFPDHTLPRDEALARINEAVRQAAERLKKRGLQVHAPAAAAGETKLLVRRGPVQVKIEVNFVMWGHRAAGAPGLAHAGRARCADGRPGDPGGLAGGRVRRQAGGGARSAASA